MSKKEKRLLKRIIIAAVLFVPSLILHYRDNIFPNAAWNGNILIYIEPVVFTVIYIIIGWDVVLKALKNLRGGQMLDEHFLMTVATIGAFCLGEYAEGVAVMLFYQVGELFQSYAVSRSRKSIAQLMDIRPDYANVLRDGELITVDPEEVKIGESIVIKPGERIPLDGVVTQGYSAIDTSSITGESVPRDVEAGQSIISGCINQTGILTVEVTKEFGQSTVVKILELVENASDKKSKSEAFITRFARYYTPVVVFAALALAIIPPLITGQGFGVWVKRALTFLVISCPCALVISVPLSFFGGIGGASKSGVLVKGSNYLEQLANTEIVVFDKTGTLTKGNFELSGVYPNDISSEELLRLAAHAEDYSSHPIAKSIVRAYGSAIDMSKIGDVQELSGHGVRAIVEGREVIVGNSRLMEDNGISSDSIDSAGTVVHVAVDRAYAGYMTIEDEVKQDAGQAIRQLKNAGVRQTVMLTGDIDAVGQSVGKSLGLDRIYTQLLPTDKVYKVEELMKEKSDKGVLAFVGDGINDAPVLARADIGIAMGGMGSDAAIEAADVVIMTDEPSKISTVINISKKTISIVRQNIVFALGVKLIVLIMGAMGLVGMWAAVFADVGVSVIAILNAMRALRVREEKPRAEKSGMDNPQIGQHAA